MDKDNTIDYKKIYKNDSILEEALARMGYYYEPKPSKIKYDLSRSYQARKTRVLP